MKKIRYRVEIVARHNGRLVPCAGEYATLEAARNSVEISKKWQNGIQYVGSRIIQVVESGVEDDNAEAFEDMVKQGPRRR